jgi:hypothetical protein
MEHTNVGVHKFLLVIEKLNHDSSVLYNHVIKYVHKLVN